MKAEVSQFRPLIAQLREELAELKTSTESILNVEVEKRRSIESELANLKTSSEKALSTEIEKRESTEVKLVNTKSNLPNRITFGQY